MKLSDFAHAADIEYRYLQQRIDALPEKKAFIFNNCELPRGCVPGNASVGFYKESSTTYAMYLGGNVRYSGDNQSMKALCEGHQIFQDFDARRQFFRLLPEVPESSDPSAHEFPEPSPLRDSDAYNRNAAINISELTLPTSESKTAPDYRDIERELEKSIVGQETAVETIAHQVAMHLKKNNPKKPLSIVCYGSPGTGKSETAKLLAKTISKLGPHRYTDVWTDLNQFSEAHSVYRLIGSPPGYVGYDDKPIFETVVQNPYTVYIFDELDKAHPDVLKTFMAILDEGRCAARKEQANHSREYDFRHCIFIFTSNYQLREASPKRKIGFSFSDDVEDISSKDNTIEVSYRGDVQEDECIGLTRRIYRNTEAARKAFVKAGVLREIASRFNCFVEFKELSDEAKIRILAKQVVETGFEYNIRLTHISPDVMRSLINASVSENALTVRSFKPVIEGYLAAAFSDAGARFGELPVRLEGSLESPVIAPAG